MHLDVVLFASSAATKIASSEQVARRPIHLRAHRRPGTDVLGQTGSTLGAVTVGDAVRRTIRTPTRQASAITEREPSIAFGDS